MRQAIAASLLCTLALGASARAQCSSWTNTMAIAAAKGGSFDIDTVLSNNADFLFIATAPAEVVGFIVDEESVKVVEGWSEDGNGTAVLMDEDGDVCTIACDGNGGIQVSIAGPGFDALSWKVRSSGAISMPGDTCGCSGGAGSGDQNQVCTRLACLNAWACRPESGGYCQEGTLPAAAQP